MAVRIWVGRFGIAQGQAQEIGPWQGVFTRQPSGEEPALLYVLVHPALPASEQFCGQLVAVIGHLFERQSLSLTGALTKAIGAAHENLRDWNRRSLREHQVGAGLSCLAVRGTLAYLAQAGPSLAYVKSQGEFRRVTPQDPVSAAVVGLGEELRPEITRYDLAPGDLVLISSPTLSDFVDDATLQEVFAGESEQALAEIYLLARDQPDFSAFLLTCYEEAEEAIVSDVQPMEDETTTPSIASPVEGAAPVTPTPSIELEEEAEPLFPAHETESVPYTDEEQRVTPTYQWVSPPRPTLGAGTGVRLRSAQPSLRRHFRSTASLPQSMPLWAISIFGFLALALVLAFCVFPDGEKGDARFVALVSEARDTYSTALATTDLSEKRTLLETVKGLLDEAAEIRPDDGEVQALRLEVAQALAEMDAVYEVNDLRLIADLSTQVTGDISLQRLAVGGGVAYLVDRKEGRVIAMPLNEPDAIAEVVLAEGDLAGAVEAARPMLITWDGDTDGGRLLVLDSDRHLFGFRPGEGASPLSLRGADGWDSADGMAWRNGNLYVLDAGAGQVWRYLPTEGGFDSERTGLLSAADLKGAIGVAVADDVFVLTEEGGVRRFSNGQEVWFEIDGIDQPLTSPASLLPMDEDTLLVVDRGKKRVVAFSRDGAFERQFVSSTFTDLQAVAVDGLAGKIYFLDGDSLYEAALPAPEGQPAPPPPPTPTAEAAPTEEAEPPVEEEAAPVEEAPAEEMPPAEEQAPPTEELPLPTAEAPPAVEEPTQEPPPPEMTPAAEMTP